MGIDDRGWQFVGDGKTLSYMVDLYLKDRAKKNQAIRGSVIHATSF